MSQRRARWVREYLVQKGIAPQRLTSEGFGMEKPIDTNATLEGRANNRRVEFVVIEQAPPESRPLAFHPSGPPVSPAARWSAKSVCTVP